MSPIQLLPLASVLAPMADRVVRGVADLAFGQLFARDVDPDQPNEIQKATGGEIGDLQPRRTDHLERLAEADLQAIVDRVNETLRANGFDPDTPFELKLGMSGGLLVDSNHQQRAALEEALDAEPQLADTFRRLSATASAAWRQQHPGERIDGELRFVWRGAEDVSIHFE